MPEYVDGDEWVEQRKQSLVEEGKLHRRIEWITGVAFAAFTLLYAVFGGRGWLAGSIFLGVSLVALVVDASRVASYWFHSVNENRLPILEERTDRIDAGVSLVHRKVDPNVLG